MFIVSLVCGFAGPFADKIYTIDYWHPLTLTNTAVGIEAFIFGFAFGGVAAVLYEETFRKRISKRRVRVKKKLADIGFLLLLFPTLFLFSFFILEVGSFYATVIGGTLSLAYMLWCRPDLWPDAVVTGILTTIIGAGSYFLLFTVWPNFIHDFWVLNSTWYTTLWFGIPLEEYIWYFLIGANIGPLYEFMTSKRLVRARK